MNLNLIENYGPGGWDTNSTTDFNPRVHESNRRFENQRLQSEGIGMEWDSTGDTRRYIILLPCV